MRRVPVPFGASVDEITGQLVESNIRFEIDRALPPNTVVSYYISVTIPSHLTQSITMPPASSSIILRCRKLVETKDHVVVLYFCDKTKNMTTSVTASPLKIHLNTFKISNETSKDLLECKDNKEILPRTFRPSILKRSMKGKEISWEEFQRITRNNDTLIVKSNNNNNTIQTSVLNHFRKIWNRCNCQYDCVRSAMCMFFRTLVSLHRTYSVPFEPSYEFVLSSSQVESLFRDWPDVAFCHEDVGDDDGLCLSALICVVLRLGYRWLDGEKKKKKKKKKEHEEKKHIVKPPTYSNSTTSSTRQKNDKLGFQNVQLQQLTLQGSLLNQYVLRSYRFGFKFNILNYLPCIPTRSHHTTQRSSESITYKANTFSVYYVLEHMLYVLCLITSRTMKKG